MRNVPWQIWLAIFALLVLPIGLTLHHAITGSESGKVCADGARRYLCPEDRRG